MLIPPLALVTPVPFIVPPDQVNGPVIARVPTPVSVPALSFRDANVTVVPVAKVTVPPVMLFVSVLRLELALKFTTPAEKIAVPAPLTEDPALKLKVPFEKLSEAPAAAPKLDASVPPPEKANCVPLFAATVPPLVLLNATLIVSLVPPVISKVPALLNAGVPPLKIMPFEKLLLPFTMFQVAPAWLFTTAPFDMTRTPPPVAFPNVVVPEAFNVRVSRNTSAFGMLIPPLALVTPVPLIVPPDQFSRPLTVKFEVPVNVPPDKVSVEVLTAPPTLLKFAVPLLMVSAPALVNVPVKFAVPPFTVVPPGML
jgi:hypothetical protein